VPVAFTVDRAGALVPGVVLGRTRHRDIEPPELQDHVDELFPRGVTRHGNEYLLNGGKPAQDVSGNIELLFEYVRRARFPNAPSRFESIFGWEDPQAARDFGLRCGQPNAAVWEVESTLGPFRADMRCLTLDGSVLGISYLAERYWSQLEAAQVGQPEWELLLTPPVRVLRKI